MKRSELSGSRIFGRRMIALVIALMYYAGMAVPGFAAPELPGNFAKLKHNSLLFDNPRPDANIICQLFPGEKIMPLKNVDVSDDGQYLDCIYVETGSRGYIMISDVEFISEAEYNAIQQTNATPTMVASTSYVQEDPTSKYQMPAPVYNVLLIGERRQAVYNAPGTNSLRSKTAKGTEAYVDISEAVTLLAVDGAWGLIEYKTTTGHRRGYIQSSGIPNSAYNSAGEVPKANLIGATTRSTALVNDTSMTNDAYVIQSMPIGTTVTVLAFDHSWGAHWAYVETYHEGKLVRGFILLDTIELLPSSARG